MSKKRHIVHIWFLDENLQASAQMLDDKSLNKTIDGCIGAIVSTCLHLVGIRSKKMHSFMFSKENMQLTLAEKFSGWPLSNVPRFNAYSWHESRWCRMCHENYDCIVSYLHALLDEYAYRYSSKHKVDALAQWASTNNIISSFPYAQISSITLPWKSIEPRFRSSNIIEGYRNQYCSQIEDGDPFLAYSRCKRDIPDFVVDAFHLDNAFER